MSRREAIEQALSAETLLDPDDLDRHLPQQEGAFDAAYADRSAKKRSFEEALKDFKRNPEVTQILESRLSGMRSSLYRLNDSAAADQIKLRTMTKACVQREEKAIATTIQFQAAQQVESDTQERNQVLLSNLRLNQEHYAMSLELITQLRDRIRRQDEV